MPALSEPAPSFVPDRAVTYIPSMPETSSRSPSSWLMLAAAFVIVVAGMRAAEPIIVPFLLSVFLAIISAPPLFWMEHRGLPRWAAMLVVVFGIVAAGVGLSVLIGNSLADFSRDIPLYKERLNGQAETAIDWLQGHGVKVSKQDAFSVLKPGAAIELVGDLFNGFGGVLANTFLIFLTVVFILFETSSFPRKLHAVVDDPEHSLFQFQTFSENLKRYLAIKTMASLGTGLVIGVVLALMGVQYAILWGLLAFLLNYVPNIGSVIAAVPAVLFALIQLGPGFALATAVLYLVTNVVVGSVIEPRYMGRGLGLSALVVFLSLVFWGWVLGPVGMFLSVPLTMTVKIALGSHQDTRWISVLLGAGSASELAASAEHPADELR